MEPRADPPELLILADAFAVLRGAARAGRPGKHVVFRESPTRVVIETFPASPPVAANDFQPVSMKPTIA